MATQPLLAEFLASQGLHVLNTEAQGRFLVASRDFKPGQVVLRERSYAHALHRQQWGSRCWGCLRAAPEAGLQRCSKCGAVRYCGKECQVADWVHHKHECAAHRAGLLACADADVALLLARLWRLMDAGRQPYTDFGVGQLQLHSTRGDARSDADFQARLPLLRPLVGEKSAGIGTLAALRDLLDQYCSNAFTIWTDTLSGVGIGVFLAAALMNHACRPNAWTQFEGHTVIVRAVAPILAGQPVHIAYSDAVQPSPIRRAALRKQYLFLCDCDMCRAGEAGSPLPPPWLHHYDERCLQASLHAEQAEHEQCLATLQGLLAESALSELPPNHAAVASCHVHAFSACVELGRWELARAHGEKALLGLKAYFPPLHPRLGLHHMRLGQACMRCGDLASACKHIGAADVILSVSHGPSSEIVQAVKELRTLLQRA